MILALFSNFSDLTINYSKSSVISLGVDQSKAVGALVVEFKELVIQYLGCQLGHSEANRQYLELCCPRGGFKAKFLAYGKYLKNFN